MPKYSRDLALNLVESAFAKAAPKYEKRARLQAIAAARLLELIHKWGSEIPEGTILELGAGTGLVSQKLISCWPEREFFFSDIAEPMLDQCCAKIGDLNCYHFLKLDASLPLPGGPYAAVVSGLTLQWLADPKRTLSRWIQALVPGGKLYLSFQGAGSFAQWQAACGALDLPFLANPLPEGQEIQAFLTQLPGKLRWENQVVTLDYPNAADFFKELKEIGAATSALGERLTTAQMRQLLTKLDQREVKMGHVVHYASYEAPR